MARIKTTATRKRPLSDKTVARKVPRPSLVIKSKDRHVADAAVRRPHRYHPGTVALREIHKLQRDPSAKMIPKAAFERLVREIAQDFRNDARFTAGALDTLKEVAESEVSKLFQITQTLLSGSLRVVKADGKTQGMLKGRMGVTVRAMRAARLMLHQIAPSHPMADGSDENCRALGYKCFRPSDRVVTETERRAMEAARQQKRAEKKAKRAERSTAAAGAAGAAAPAASAAAAAPPALEAEDDDDDDAADAPIGASA